jgi:hypothetical protein
MTRYTYEWERRHAKRFDRMLDNLILESSKILPKGYYLVGVAIAHGELAEACYLSTFTPENDIWDKDVLNDIWVDAQRQYDECFTGEKP